MSEHTHYFIKKTTWIQTTDKDFLLKIKWKLLHEAYT